jgi:hypothetical protein
MANFESVLPALMNGKEVRRDEWGCGSCMYVNAQGQFMRTPTQYPRVCGSGAPFSVGQDYDWILDLNDVTAKDWSVVRPLSRLARHRQFPNPSATHRKLTSVDTKLAFSESQGVFGYVERFTSVFHQLFRRDRTVAE